MDSKTEERLYSRAESNPFAHYLGMEFLSVSDGEVKARMPLKEEQKQYSGVVHGGVLAAFADTVALCAAYTQTPLDKDVLAGELKMSFLRAAWGDELTARGYVIKAGRNIHFCECEVFCEEKMIAKCSGTFCVVPAQVKG